MSRGGGVRAGWPRGWAGLLAGVALLLALPTLVVGSLWGYAGWRNQQAGEGALACRVSSSLVLGDGPVDAGFAFTAPGGSLPAQSMDMTILVDVSGSMRSSLPTIGRAIQDLANRLLDGSGRVRLSVVQFDIPAVVKVPWTSDIAAVTRGTGTLEMMEAGNDTREAFKRLRELLASSRPGSSRVAVFFTDGGLEVEPGVMPWPEIAAEASALRNDSDKVRFYAIGLPGSLDSRMGLITGDDAALLGTSSIADFVEQLRKVALQELTVFARGATLQAPLYGQAFVPQLGPIPWEAGTGEALAFNDWLLLAGSNVARLPLQTSSAGLWSLGDSPARVQWNRADGTAGDAACPTVPMVLMLPWWLVLLGLLPALALFAWGAERLLRLPSPPPQLSMPPLPSVAPVDTLALPRRHVHRAPYTPVPTLVVGLGGQGRLAVEKVAGDFRLRLGTPAGEGVSFLRLDVDGRAANASDNAIAECLIAPREATALSSVISNPSAHTLEWLDQDRYRNAALTSLDLSQGAQGDRMLARLALTRWLEHPDSLYPRLEAAVDDLARRAKGTTPQIILMASTGGGFGSGTVIDVARLLRRIDRSRRGDGGRGVEIALLLAGGGHGNNQTALLNEVQLAQLCGHFPHPTTYGTTLPALDMVDEEPPANWLFSVPGNGSGEDLLDVAAALCDPDTREGLIRQLPAAMLTPVSITARTLATMPHQVRDLIADQLPLRLAGEILPDLETAPGGGYRLAAAPAGQDQNALERWFQNDATAPLWRDVLAIAVGLKSVPAFHQDALPYGPPDRAWFAQALTISANTMLANAAAGWTLSQAAAALELFANRLQAEHDPTLSDIAATAEGFARALQGWRAQLPGQCERLARHLASVSNLAGQCTSPGWRTYPQGDATAAETEPLSLQVLDRMKGGTSASRFLRFEVGLEYTGPAAWLRSGLGTPRRYNEPETALTSLHAQMRDVAGELPEVQIAGILENLPGHQTRLLLEGLAPATASHDGAVLALPAAGTSHEEEALDRLAAMVRPPAGVISSIEVSSRDTSTIRRLAWSPLPPPAAATPGLGQPLPTQAAAVAAARMHRQMETELEQVLPPLPPALAIAVSRRRQFRQFAALYAAGRIARARATDGSLQWRLAPEGPFLTGGSKSSLSQAAATYCSGNPPDAPEPPPTAEEHFSLLDDWVRGKADDADLEDVLALAAMRKVLR